MAPTKKVRNTAQIENKRKGKIKTSTQKPMKKSAPVDLCTKCGKIMVVKYLSKDNSTICDKCKAIEDAKTDGQKDILHLVRRLDDLKNQVPKNDSGIDPVQKRLAQILRWEYSMKKDFALEKSRENLDFEEWVILINSGALDQLPKDPLDFQVTVGIRNHIKWVSEDMLEFN